MSHIHNIHARQILDSRGNPTIEVDVYTDQNIMGSASVPSGASTGKYEAVELRDENSKFYLGRAVTQAIQQVNTTIKQALLGHSLFDQAAIDNLLIDLDGTTNKSHLGANAILGVSLAVAKTAAHAQHMPLYRYWGGADACIMPTPMINILNGGVHANNLLDIQEFMIVPVKADTFADALRMGVEVFHQLGYILQEKGLATTVGDEGGFAPRVDTHEQAVELILQAIEKAHYKPGEDIFLALDAASTAWYDNQAGVYHFNNSVHQQLRADQLVDFWESWVHQYPILSIEDGMAEEDWLGWKKMTDRLGSKIQLVGDDLFVTHASRLQRGIDSQVANAILVKMNQVGTLTETFATVNLAQAHGYRTIISHRSGETEDCSIADLAVAFNTGQIKTGSVARTDRTAKYNQLLRIEEQLGHHARFAGKPF